MKTEINIVEESGTNYVSSEFFNYEVIASCHKEIYDGNYKVENNVTIVRQDCTSNLAGENNLKVVNIEEQWKRENGMKHIGETNDTRETEKRFIEYETSNTKNNETEPSVQIEVTEGIDGNKESVGKAENSKTFNHVAEQAELNKIEKTTFSKMNFATKVERGSCTNYQEINKTCSTEAEVEKKNVKNDKYHQCDCSERGNRKGKHLK
ncbi:hypothetical protein JTB14_007682 [Gonioctena quinquepunctata]|nr:hypothetical protein JTB14_007682 [Gonioctena quinquepunctata]